MFCPKCGTVNPEDGKFCRGCGVELEGVSAALSGDSSANSTWGSRDHRRSRRKTDPDELFPDAIRSIVFGFGFLAISAALFVTNVANGRSWWWAMLFPAVSFLAKGISDCVRANRLTKSRAAFAASAPAPQLNQVAAQPGLPQAQPPWPTTETRYKTGDLVPPSVTDNTTRHLAMDTEGKTMTLPKK